jgi:peptidoglycan/xylan/chitin deacetylase (PgdA/CDA1 family)
LSWAQVKALRAAGWDIGSHTRHHSRLSQAADRRCLVDEIVGAKTDIEQALGEPCRFMSWPFGTAADVNAAALDVIDEAGFDLCFSAIRGRVRPGSTQRLSVPRHHVEADWPWLHIRYFASGGREDG